MRNPPFGALPREPAVSVRCARSGRSRLARPRPSRSPSAGAPSWWSFGSHGGGGPDAHCRSAAAAVPIRPGVGEAVRKAAVCERAGLLGGPAVTGQALGARSRQPFDGHQAAAGLQDPPGLSQACVQVGPVVHGGDGPRDRHRRIGQWQGLCAALGLAHRVSGAPGEQAGGPHITGAGSIPTTEAPRLAARRAAVPGPHPMSATASLAASSLRRSARRALRSAPSTMLAAARNPAGPAKPR